MAAGTGKLTFGGSTFKGAVGLGNAKPYDAKSRQRHYWGVQGYSEIRGSRGKRMILVNMWLFDNFNTRQKCIDEIDKMENLIMVKHGTLKLESDPNNKASYPDCTLYRVERMPTGPQGGTAPIEDVGSSLDGGFWVSLQLEFHQLT